MKELQRKLNDLKKLEMDYEAVRNAKSALYESIMNVKQQIAEYFRDQMLSEIDMNGKKYKAGFKTEYNYLGGDIKDPEKKNDVIQHCVNAGFLDEEKVTEIKKLIVNTNSLNAAMRKMPDEIIDKMIDDKLISISQIPFVDVKK